MLGSDAPERIRGILFRSESRLAPNSSFIRFSRTRLETKVPGCSETYIQDIGCGQGWSPQCDRAESIPGMSLLILNTEADDAAKMLLRSATKSRIRRYSGACQVVRPRRCHACTIFLDTIDTSTSRPLIWSAVSVIPAHALAGGRGYHRNWILVSTYHLHPARPNGNYVDCAAEVWIWRRAGSAGRLLAAEVCLYL